jgi:ABC-type dipeptide/oligopeptide/nickel transport system permease component
MMGLGLSDINLRFALPEIAAAVLRYLREFSLTLISAAAIAEWVFHRSGAALLFLNAAATQDWAVASAVLFLFAAITLVIGFSADALASLIVPEEVL